MKYFSKKLKLENSSNELLWKRCWSQSQPLCHYQTTHKLVHFKIISSHSVSLSVTFSRSHLNQIRCGSIIILLNVIESENVTMVVDRRYVKDQRNCFEIGTWDLSPTELRFSAMHHFARAHELNFNRWLPKTEPKITM